LVSHDRNILDACIDHVLVLNRKTIEVQSGNFSSWWENKTRMDHFAMEENEKHLKEIASLKQAAARSWKWADKNEATKIGYDPVKEHDRSVATRAYIGAKTKKMQSRVTQYERRMEREIQEKEGLLQDIEQPVSLKLMPLSYHKERLISCQELSVRYEGAEDYVLKNLTFELVQGERVFLHGENGCGKSTLIKTILQQSCSSHAKLLVTDGENRTASNLVVSYINQDTSFLRGDIRDFCRERNLEESLFFALLRQLDMERAQFEKRLEEFSEGQKRRIKNVRTD
jgi:ATPase subunit of ABC transporter with duplicated ATPase domains